MFTIDLTGRRALVAGVADDAGYGLAIAKALDDCGATVVVGTWPHALNIFNNLLERGKLDASRRLSNGEMMEFERIYPLDAAFARMADGPADLRTDERFANARFLTIGGVAERLVAAFVDRPLDIVVHSLANRP